jgi:hypothetical protein
LSAQVECASRVGKTARAAGVAKERIKPIGRVVAAGGVVQERLITVGRVADPLSWFSESGFIGVYPWP